MTNEQAYAKARALTAENQHQEAVLVIAKHFQCASIAKAVEGVIMIHEARGFLDHPLSEMMQRLRSELYEQIEITHGSDARRAVYGCF